MTKRSPTEAIYFTALEKATPQERAAYLDEACGPDRALRRRVERLLSTHERVGNFLEQPAVLILGPDTPLAGEWARPGDGKGWAGDLPPRYELRQEIGRGGMGRVFLGRDADLDRDVAVKVLVETGPGGDELVRRFVEEAKTCGRLQHPGVVPVYELGMAGKTPFFTMKLVQGQTLAVLLKQRRESGEGLSWFVGIFEAVCQAVAYAHARGVIHRDLKPANVMVGAFGEVQVMDWGLAKVLGERSELARSASEAGAPSLALRANEQTQAGSVLGTPAYMAPEQARGEPVDERADVFGLGSLLCEALTGQAAFTGDIDEAYRQAKSADLAGALGRLDACGCDAELVALARRCLAAAPDQRPRNAGVVAETVAAYRRSVTERLQQAQVERARAEVKAKEERKRRRLTVGLAAAVLALVTGGAGAGLWLERLTAQREADRRESAVREESERRREVESGLARAAELQKQARWGEARVALELARERLGEGSEDELHERIRQALADLELVGRLDAVRIRGAEWTDASFDYRRADRGYEEVFRQAGLGSPGAPAADVAGRIVRSNVREVLVAALDDWAARARAPARREWLLEVARRADAERWRDRFRDPRAWSSRAGLEELARQAPVDRLSSHLLSALGSGLWASGGDPLPLLRRAQARHPSDFWLTTHLAVQLSKVNQKDEALGYFRAALALRPDTSVAHQNVAVVLERNNRMKEALGHYQKAVELGPRNVEAHVGLGQTLHRLGKSDEASACFHKAIEIERGYFRAHFALGRLQQTSGKVKEAIASFSKAAELEPRSALAQVALGEAHAKRGDRDRAITYYRKAIELDPGSARAYVALGLALDARGKRADAVALWQKARSLEPGLTEAHYNLGNALSDEGKMPEASACFRKAIACDPNHAESHCNLGFVLGRMGHFAESLKEYRRGDELGRQRRDWRYPSGDWLRTAQRLADQEARLPAVRDGKARPRDNADRLGLAGVAMTKKLFLLAAQLYAEAFRAQPEEAARLEASYRTDAVRCALLTARGLGLDAGPLDDGERAHWRRQALDWLRAEVAARGEQARGGQAALARQALQGWLDDPSASGVRDDKAVAKLPAQERADWRKLWADVRTHLGKKSPP
jgi:tetratricopeptide (TPR) repeat protein